MDRSRGGFRRPANSGRRASGARAEEGDMAEKIRDTEFRHPELAAFLQGLTDEQAATPGPLSVERGGVASQYWREDGRVHCREFEAASGGPSSEMEALHAETAAAFGHSLPRMRAGRRGGGVPDLDAIETSIRDDLPGGGAAGRRGSGSGRHRDVDPRRSAGRRGEVLRGAARGVRRRSSAPVLPALRPADGPSRPGREDVRDALRTGPGRTAPFPLPRVRRQLFPFGPGAGSGRQERHARRGKPLCGRRQFRQLRAGAPPAEEFRRRGGSGVDSPAPCREARRRPARRRPSSAARPTAWTRRPESRGRTGRAGLPASASTARRP